MSIYFIRHGQTDVNLRIINGEVIGETDASLAKNYQLPIMIKNNLRIDKIYNADFRKYDFKG